MPCMHDGSKCQRSSAPIVHSHTHEHIRTHTFKKIYIPASTYLTNHFQKGTSNPLPHSVGDSTDVSSSILWDYPYQHQGRR